MPEASTLALTLGWAGAALSAVLALPQAVALLRSSGETRISIRPWQALLASNSAWIYYGLATGDLPIAVSSTISAIISTSLVTMIAGRAGPRRLPLYLAEPLAAAVLLAAASRLPAVFGILSAVPSTVGWSLQAWRFHVEGRPNSFSLAGAIFYLTCQAVWLTYAILRSDWALIASTTPLITTVTVATCLYFKAEPRRERRTNASDHDPPTEPVPTPHS